MSEQNAERLWCLSCGTVTRNGICDCNTYGKGHEMYREPNFVNYADQLQSDSTKIYMDFLAVGSRLETAMKALEDIDKHLDNFGYLPNMKARKIARQALAALRDPVSGTGEPNG